MKLSVLITLVILLNSLQSNAQNIAFERMPPVAPVPEVIADLIRTSSGEITFADVDGDNDPDVLITGGQTIFAQKTILYLNDGIGNYAKAQLGNTFERFHFSSVAFRDIDNDNDVDLLIIGDSSYQEPVTKLYTNDGLGNFSEVMGTPFEDLYKGDLAFSDVDGDSDPDVLITGYDVLNQPVTKLYSNDGTGNFTEVIGTPFEDVGESSIQFLDIENDNDLDVLITGLNGAGDGVSRLYSNNGVGNFTLVSGTPFVGVHYGSVDCADVDSDSDIDIVISGTNNSNQPTSRLYLNDGTGLFAFANSPFEGVELSSIGFADLDSDNDPDLLITGLNNSNDQVSNVYLNNGFGSFTELQGSSLLGMQTGSVDFADVDNDNDLDVVLSGYNLIANSILYINDGSANFAEATGTPFARVWRSANAFADIDGDNDNDLILTGYQPLLNLALMYKNDGNGNFTLFDDTTFEGGQDGAVAFADIDNDTDLDLLITGRSASGTIAKLYRNDGLGNFTEEPNSPFLGVEESSVDFGDVDGDNDLDVIIIGRSGIGVPTARLYLNDGTGSYTTVIGTPFDGAAYGGVDFADIDGDGDLDVFITGSPPLGQYKADMYLNDGLGNFTEQTMTPFQGVGKSDVAFADFDGDNDPDLVYTGFLNSPNAVAVTLLYRNNGGTFTEETMTPFTGSERGSLDVSDVDGDGDIDILISGVETNAPYFTALYANDGTGNFTEVTGLPLDDVWLSSIVFSDVDGDQLPDVLVTGQDLELTSVSKLYLNKSTCSLNTMATENGLDLISSATGVQYQWIDCDNNDAPINGETNQIFTPTLAGNYAVILTTNTCTDTSDCINFSTIGIDDLHAEDAFSFYPNPTNGSISIEFNSTVSRLEIEILTIEGKILSTTNYTMTDSITFDLNQATGIYIVAVTTPEYRKSIRIIKQSK